MPIQRVESITYGVEDVELGIRFFEDFGLTIVERANAGAKFKTLENQIIHLYRADDSSLPPAHTPGSTLRKVVWGVDTQGSLNKLAADLAADREVALLADASLQTVDESGLAIGLCIANRTPFQVQPEPVNVGDFAPRKNTPRHFPDRTRPIRLVHAVFEIRKEGYEKAAGFYRERLKFRLSERSLNAGDFMRCEASMDHHNLLLLHRTDRIRFNHVAFEVMGLDDLVLGGLHMRARGWKAARAPGRHFLGSNLHWFFENPCGGRVEYLTDMDRLTPDWEPRVFEKHPGQSVWLLGDEE